MVALQTSDSDPRTDPTGWMAGARPLEPIAPDRGWSAAHPAVRARRGQLPTAPRSTQALTVSRAAPVAGPNRRLVYLRRRLVAAVVLLAFMWAAIAVAADLVGGGAGSAGAVEEVRTHLVSDGETWWSLATELDRPGDVRDTVEALIELNRSEELRAGQRVVLPVG